MLTLLCVCPPRVESLFPPVLSKSCNQFPLDFKVWFSRNYSSRCRTPRLGRLTCGSEPSLQWVDFCGISVLQSVSHPPTSYGIWFYCDCDPPTVSLWLLLCLWTWGIFFGEFQCLPVDDCPAASCDSGVLARGSESTSFYSTILVPPSFISFWYQDNVGFVEWVWKSYLLLNIFEEFEEGYVFFNLIYFFIQQVLISYLFYTYYYMYVNPWRGLC